MVENNYTLEKLGPWGINGYNTDEGMADSENTDNNEDAMMEKSQLKSNIRGRHWRLKS